MTTPTETHPNSQASASVDKASGGAPLSTLVRAYTSRKLDAESLERFEHRMFRDAELLDQVESDQTLQRGLKSLSRIGKRRTRRKRLTVRRKWCRR